MRGRVHSPPLLSNHDGVGQDLCVKARGHYQVVDSCTAAVNLAECPARRFGDGNLMPRSPVDGDDDHGVLIQPPLFAPCRQDRLLVADRGEGVEGMLVLLLVAPLDLARAALQLH